MAKKKLTEETPEMSAIVEIKPLASGRVLSESTEKLSLVEQIQAHVLLKKVGEAVAARLSELRDPLMSVAQAKGDVQNEESGTKKYVVEGNSICVEFRKSKTPAEDKTQALLKEKGIAVGEVFDTVTVPTLVFNASKLAYLVQIGKVTQVEYDSLFPAPTPALRVYPSKELKAAVEMLGMKSKPKLEEGAPQAAFESGEKK